MQKHGYKKKMLKIENLFHFRYWFIEGSIKLMLATAKNKMC